METDLEEIEIKAALLGDEKAQLGAVVRAYHRYRKPLASYIRERVGPTLDQDELASAVNDVFVELARKAKEGRLRENGSLSCLLFRMARANAIDQLRKQTKRTAKQTLFAELSSDEQDTETGDFVERVAQRLAESPEIASLWKGLTEKRTPGDELATNEIVRQFRVWLGGLPSLQRKVAESMATHFGSVTDEEICNEIAEKYGTRPPVSSIKSARAEIREKFTSLMKHQERSTLQ